MSAFGWTPSEHRDELAQFARSQEHEDAMKDTEPSRMDTLVQHLTTIDGHIDKILQPRNDENALLRRSLEVLTRRIEDLEAENDDIRANAQAVLEPLERVAQVLKTFYFAPVTLSSVQPIIALAFELNPDLVEQKR